MSIRRQEDAPSAPPPPTPPRTDHLIPGREGGKPSATPPAHVHREQGKPMVKE